METVYSTLAPYCTFTLTAIIAKLLLLLSAIPAKADDARDVIAVTQAVESYKASAPVASTAVVFHRRGVFRDRVTAVEMVQPAAPVVHKTTTTEIRTMRAVPMSGGCANGSCGTAGVSVRRGFFRR